MKGFSIGRALGDAFGLMARRPLAAFVWGLLVLGPVLVGFAMMFPAMGRMFAEMSAEAAAGSEVDQLVFAEVVRLQAASMLMNIGQLVGAVFAYTAIMRAVLRPQDHSYFSLRVGMDELRVAVVGLAIGIGLYVALVIALLLGAALVAALWGLGRGLAIGLAVTLGLATLVAALWGMARVSLMAPASVLYRDFAFIQGWRLAAGKAWPLLGMMLVILLIILAAEMMLALAALGAGLATWPSDWSEAANPLAALASWAAANWPWLIMAALLGCLFYGLALTLTVAPFASACRQLSEDVSPPLPAEPAGSPVSAA